MSTRAQTTLSRPAMMPSFTPLRSSILQRKCACGGQGGAAGQCKECKEQLQRKAVEHQEESLPVPPVVHEVLRSGGEPLEVDTRARMETRFKHDFGKVRVHTDARAAESARSVNALAYTIGRDVVFASGHYQPQTQTGRHLIAHELAHTIQQQSASSPSLQTFDGVRGDDQVRTHSDHNAEIEADRAADAAIAGEPVALRQVSPLALARQPVPTNIAPRDIPGPSPTAVKDEEKEKPKTDFSKVGMSQEWGHEKTLLGWGSPETNNIYQDCRIAPLEHTQFVAFAASLPSSSQGKRGASTPSGAQAVTLGITNVIASQAKPPKIAAMQVNEGNKTVFKLKPTHAEMPPIQSAYTQKGKFQEGLIASGEPGCKAERARLMQQTGQAKFPVNWEIDDDGADRIRAGEQEHCDDIRYAFHMTLAIYASAINNVAAAERTYSTEAQAIKDGENSLTGLVQPSDMLLSFVQMAAKTNERDNKKYHLPNIGVLNNSEGPTPDNGCRAIEKINKKSLPQVCEHTPGKEPSQKDCKHPSEEVLG